MKNKNSEPMSVLKLTVKNEKLFFGENGHGIARYDIVNYPVFTKLNNKMLGFFWRPQEVDMSQEKASFEKMTESEKFVFTSNLKRQILLDSIQGRAPGLAFLPYCTDPSLENCILTWGMFESIHSESYTHIIRAIYPDPSVIFDDLPNIKEIADCANQISVAYDNLMRNPSHKNLYLALIAANALEAIRFFVSFACTFSFLERGMVEGSAKTVKLIARDENVHLALTQHIIKNLIKSDPTFINVIKDSEQEAQEIFYSAQKQEKEWAKYLFKNGPVLGLNESILGNYIDYLTLRRMKAINLTSDVSYKGGNPIPWIEKHLTSENTQVAPQEVEIASYLSASTVENDLKQFNIKELWNQDLKI